MRVFIVVSCFLALAAAQHYNGPYHIPVIGPNGVPQEPPELVAARRTHLANFQNAPQQPQQQWNQQQPQQQWNQGQPQWNQGQQQQWNQPPPQQNQYAPPQPRYNGPLAKIGPDGMPQYDSAVANARASHQAAYAEVNARNGALHSQISGQSQPHWG